MIQSARRRVLSVIPIRLPTQRDPRIYSSWTAYLLFILTTSQNYASTSVALVRGNAENIIFVKQ